jgi:hypothetical protein
MIGGHSEVISMNENEQLVDGVRYGPVVREMPEQYGSVPGLDAEELAGPEELERWAMHQQWGPILDLPVRRNHRWTRPTVDAFGNLDGAFATMDFERLYGTFDKFRYKSDKLREELESQLIMLSIIIDRVPGRSKYIVLRYLNMGVIDLDDITDPDMHALARRHLRCKKLRRQIHRLRQLSRKGWCDPEED